MLGWISVVLGAIGLIVALRRQRDAARAVVRPDGRDIVLLLPPRRALGTVVRLAPAPASLPPPAPPSYNDTLQRIAAAAGSVPPSLASRLTQRWRAMRVLLARIQLEAASARGRETTVQLASLDAIRTMAGEAISLGAAGQLAVMLGAITREASERTPDPAIASVGGIRGGLLM